MIITKEEFLDQPRKAITLIGMSGVGKSYIASKLESWGWINYSCDHLIGTQYLADKVQGAVSADNIVNLSAFVGKIGDEAKGGVSLDEFKARQQMYYDAECAVLADMPAALDQTAGNFVNDSSGSLCEVQDQSILEAVGQKTVFVYLKVCPAEHPKILKRAIDYPKPLFFPADFFEQYLGIFQKEFNAPSIQDIDPDVFLSWVFPHLFESRLPKYQALADAHGVTVDVDALGDIETEDDFIQTIAEALDD